VLANAAPISVPRGLALKAQGTDAQTANRRRKIFSRETHMLTKLRIENFKAWKDTGQIRLAPLTVLFGANSAGKSSLGHLLLALKQTASSADRRRALHTGDESSLIDLGTFVETLHGHDKKAVLEFCLEWTIPNGLEVQNPLEERQVYEGNRLALASTIAAGANEQPVVRAVRYELRAENDVVLTATLSHEGNKVQLNTAPYKLVHAIGRKWPLDPPEKFYRVSDHSLARFQNADFLANFALEVERTLASLSYLGPLRDHPHRTYGWAGNTPDTVGARGEYAIACILAAEASGRKLNRGKRKRQQSFTQFIAQWLVELGVIDSFTVRATAPGRKDYEVKVKTRGGLTEVALPDVGFGVSQVLPALVQAFYCPAESIVWMEQPEIHLHPQVQAELADVFISAVQAYEHGRPRNVQLIIETHSEHFLNRLQRRIAEEALRPEDVAIYFAKRTTKGAELEELKVNLVGDITNWPENFFGDEMGDIVARTEAASKRRVGTE
jgi:predicted ATPase